MEHRDAGQLRQEIPELQFLSPAACGGRGLAA